MFSLSIILCISFIGYNSVEADNHEVYIRPGVVRPCNYSDWDCIRRFFTENSACTAVYGPTPNPITLDYVEAPIPHANLTYIFKNAVVNGLNNVVITEFYINKRTGRFVLEIKLPEVVVTTPTTTIRYYLTGREPVERSDAFYMAIRSISLTMVVPYANGIEMSKGHVYTYLADSNVSYSLGPNFISSDPGLRRSFFVMLEKLLNTLQEGSIVIGPIYLNLFIENNICKFSK